MEKMKPRKIVVSDPDILGGTPVFAGTRVPVDVLFGNLLDGMSLDQILDDYPTLSRDFAMQALHDAGLLFEHKQVNL